MNSTTSYRRILNSSAIMGGAAGIVMVFGLIKTKFAAVLIGTAGIGLLASFTAIQNAITILAGLGIRQSAVRDIASAIAENDKLEIGQAVLTVRRVCWLTGLLGMAIVITLSSAIGNITFGSNAHNLEISALSLIILFANVSGGQLALIQGARRIGDIARINIASAALSAIAAVGFYFWLGLHGIIPALVVAAAIHLFISWRFAKRIPIPHVKMTWLESINKSGHMVRLGLAMMWSALLKSLVAYFAIAMITHQINIEAVGIYSAAFALSGMFVNFILNALGTDYYPRLAGVAPDRHAMNLMVNEQTEIGILLAVPGMFAIMCFAPWVIQMFYSAEFLPAVNLLQWFVIGCLISVIQWPMGYLQLALSKSNVLIFTQTLFAVTHLLLIWGGMNYLGLEGVSIAFFTLYLFSLGVIYLVARYLTGFQWSTSVIRMIIYLVVVVIVLSAAIRFLPMWGRAVFGIVGTCIATVYCLRGIAVRVGAEHRLNRILNRYPKLATIFGISIC